MPSPDLLRIFTRVAELQSFTRAAESLGITNARASTAVRDLEAELGVRLLHRTTRRVSLTNDGQTAFERCRNLLADMEELTALFRSEATLTGRLRVDMPSGIARNQVLPNLPAFLDAHPGLEIELSSTDRFVDVVREGFDCVLRIGTVADSSLVARPLGRFPVVNAASPGYLARRGTPTGPEDLPRHRLVQYVGSFGQRDPGFEYLDGGVLRTIPMPGAITVNNAEAYQHACLAGLGIVQAPRIGIVHRFEEGSLVPILPALAPPSMPVTLLYPHRRHLPRRVAVFMDWIASLVRPHLEPAP